MKIEEAVGKFKDSLLAVDKPTSFDIVSKLLDEVNVSDLVDSLIMPALEDIGEHWEKGDVSLSQVYMAGKISEELVDKYIVKGVQFNPDGKRVAVAVLQDHHNLGKKILATVLRTSGYQVIDYGHAVTVDELINNVERDSIDYLMISTLMLPAALHIKEAVQGIRQASPTTKVLVGGAPFVFDDELWKEVGADAYGRTATESLVKLKMMIKEAE